LLLLVFVPSAGALDLLIAQGKASKGRRNPGEMTYDKIRPAEAGLQTYPEKPINFDIYFEPGWRSSCRGAIFLLALSQGCVVLWTPYPGLLRGSALPRWEQKQA